MRTSYPSPRRYLGLLGIVIPWGLSFLGGCTNYSASKAQTAPPILISVVAFAPNHYRIQARAQNPELLFQGYRLYPAMTDKESRNPGSLDQGIDCLRVDMPILPNQPFEYTYEILPSPPAEPSETTTCRFIANLEPGTFITLRSMILALNVSMGGAGGLFQTSGPSNTLILPAHTP